MFRKNENNKFILTGRKEFYKNKGEEREMKMYNILSDKVISNTIQKYIYLLK